MTPIQTLLVALLAKATTELVLKGRQRFELVAKRMRQEQQVKASQPIGPRRVSENWREPVKWPGLEIEPAVWQLDPLALVFASQARPSSAPSCD
ncbi:MAG: hypothetical protein WBX14_06950 [Candidatus Udaeobacter sp.]